MVDDELGAADFFVDEPSAAPVDLFDIADVDMHVLNRMPQFGGDVIALTLPGDLLVLEAAPDEAQDLRLARGEAPG